MMPSSIHNNKTMKFLFFYTFVHYIQHITDIKKHHFELICMTNTAIYLTELIGTVFCIETFLTIL
jgi:hypothetical protein